jgi:TolA-binding protein
MQLNFPKFSQTKLTGFVCFLVLLVGGLFFAFNEYLSLPTNQAQYKPFKPSGNLAVAIEYLPINRNLAVEKLDKIKYGLSPSSDSRRLYILAQVNQRLGKLTEASEQYQKIKLNTIPYLADRVLLHQAEIAAELGEEKQVIKFAKEIVSKYQKSLSLPAAHYELGRSYLRQSQLDRAKEEFEITSKLYPDSEQAIGALYYLGVLAEDQNEKDAFWQKYLTSSLNGRFSAEIIESWEKNNFDDLSAKQKTLIGLVYYQKGNQEKASQYLDSEINFYNWFSLAEFQLARNQKQSAQSTLFKGLTNFPASPQYNQGINMFLRHSSDGEREELFPQIIDQAEVVKKPYLLWKFALSSPQKRKLEIFQRIKQDYPKTSWAGKASAESFWDAYQNGDYLAAENLGTNLLQTHQKLDDLAKVRFWLGKRAESKNNSARAKELYAEILALHPRSYYAFRAQGRLKELSGGNDPLWRIQPHNRLSLQTDWIWPLPESELTNLHPTLQELFSLNLWQEALTLMPDDYEHKYPGLHAWFLARVQDKTNEAINVIDREISEQNLNFDQKPDYWTISYPFIYSDLAFRAANRYNFDPLLVLALIRQESRFQPKVISSAKAVGLCQLMPATAREVARSLNYPTPNHELLTRPAYNIELGTKYLNGLLKQFDQNGHLAVAAYNAGPGSVQKWLRAKPDLDPDLFVETIPYKETRNYVIKVFENYWVYSTLASRVDEENSIAVHRPARQAAAV